MSEQPTIDEMKRRRDGWLVFGQRPRLRPLEREELIVRAWLLALRAAREPTAPGSEGDTDRSSTPEDRPHG
jgi:hypothetical protein